VPFDNTTPIYLINLLWKLGLGSGLDLQLQYFRIFAENNETSTLSSAHYTLGNMLLQRTHPFNRHSVLLLIEWVRSFNNMLPYVKFAEDKVLVFVILLGNARVYCIL